VFYIGNDVIRNGQLLGFYGGCKPQGDSDYCFQGGRDAIDPEGRLLMQSGVTKNTHAWSSEQWKLETADDYGIDWISGDGKSNWTRFMNHACGSFLNVRMASNSVERFGRAYAFYAGALIYPGDELFFDYGFGYFQSQGYLPEAPNVDLARPNNPEFTTTTLDHTTRSNRGATR
tara:strand:- start:441 stop:962 length:522 start_codon:yes stop_codon:yes gene_type:complete